MALENQQYTYFTAGLEKNLTNALTFNAGINRLKANALREIN